MDVLSIIRSSLSAFIMAIVRNAVVVATTWLASRKLIDAETSSQLLAFIPMVVASIGWSLIEKYVFARLNLQKLQVAASLPAGSSLAHLDEELRKQALK